MKKFVFVCVFSTLFSASVFAQGTPPAVAPPVAPDDAYLSLADHAMMDPASVNWADLRKLYAKSSFYSDFTKPSVSEAYYKAGKSAAAAPMMRQSFKDMQRQQVANFQSHIESIKIGKELPSEAINVADEQKALEAIADSIMEGADGSVAKPYAVVSSDEEKLVVETLLQEKISATIPTTIGGHHYDVVTYPEAGTKKPVKVFFNTDLVPPKTGK